MCLLKRGPQSLPVNHVFMGITLFVNLILTAALNRNVRLFSADISSSESYTQINFLSEFGMVIVATIIFAALIFVLLRTFNYQVRVYQTLFAIFGTGVIFAGLMLVVSAISSSIPLLWTLTFLAIAIWSLVVSGNILAIAIETTLFRGVLLVIAIAIVEGIVTVLIFGDQTGFAVPSTPSAT